MSKAAIPFEDFLLEVAPENLAFVTDLHDQLAQGGCAVEIQSAKSGYVVSYRLGGKVLLNYVFRKKGQVARIYADHVHHYQALLESLPDSMAKEIAKAPLCRRLADPAKCNSRCPMGYVFSLRGEEYKKCRYGSFMFLLGEESNPHIQEFLQEEIRARTA